MTCDRDVDESPESAEFIAQTAQRRPGEVTIIVTSPATNLALAVVLGASTPRTSETSTNYGRRRRPPGQRLAAWPRRTSPTIQERPRSSSTPSRRMMETD